MSYIPLVYKIWCNKHTCGTNNTTQEKRKGRINSLTRIQIMAYCCVWRGLLGSLNTRFSHTISTYTWKSKDTNTKYKAVTNHQQKYRRNTDTCTNILLNHHFINILRTPICFHPYRAIFREYVYIQRRTVTWNIHLSF